MNNKGVTLIECMIVIVILGILMGTIVARLTAAKKKAQSETSIISEECFIDENEWNDAFRLQATRRTFFDCEDFTLNLNTPNKP